MLRKFAFAAIATISMALTAQPASAVLVASYEFNEAGGTDANPTVGTVIGALTGSASFVGGGVSGNAVSITSSGGGFVNFGASLAPGGPFSVQVWVKTTAAVGAPVTYHRSTVAAGYLVAFGDISDGCGGGAGQMSFYVAYPCSGHSTTVVNDGEWHQMVGVYDGSISYVYVDGMLESQSAGLNPLNTPPGPPVIPVIAGGLANSSGTPIGGYDGLLDNIRFYDNALTEIEVLALYNQQTQDVPVPGGLAFIGVGLAVLGLRRRRSNSQT